MDDPVLAIRDQIAKLVTNLVNFNKSPNRKYLESTLIKKAEYSKNCFKEGEKLLEKIKPKLSPEVFTYYRKKLNTTFEELSTLIATKLRELTMPPKLDLSLALKIVKPFDGTAGNLQQYIESVELLKDYSTDVTEADILKFMKITLSGAAHGTIDNKNRLNDAFDALKAKFAVKLTPRAVENEMSSKRQQNKTITDFGAEIENLAAKLAAAHVSQGTFATEAAATNIVESVAVRSFVDGLQNPTTQFLLRARNPTSLNKAISDALECSPENSANPKNEAAFWCNFQQYTRGHNNNFRGSGFPGNGYRGRSSGYRRGRGNFRGRGNYRGGNYQNNYHQNNNRGQNRGNCNNNNNNNCNRNNNNRGQQDNRQANVVEENNVQQNEEVNVANLFRE